MKNKFTKLIIITSVLTLFFFSLFIFSIQKIYKDRPQFASEIETAINKKYDFKDFHFQILNVSLGDMGQGSGFNSNYSNTSDKWYFEALTQKIVVKTVNSDVTIGVATGDEIEVIATGELLESGKNKLILTDFSLSALTIKNTDSNSAKNVSIQILIPKNYKNDLEIDSVNADLNLNVTSLKQMNIKSISGDVNIQNLTMTSLNVTTVSGDVNLGLQTQLKDLSLDLSTVSGDINQPFKSNSKGPIKIIIKTVSGDILIQ